LGLSNYSFNGAGVTGQAPSGIVNADLSWELSETKDLGLDVGILKNRFTASFDIYTKNNTTVIIECSDPTGEWF
jgi:hypothetical protein